MAFISWGTKRQILYFSLFVLVILAIIGGLAWYFWPQPTCTDGKQNGTEEGIDCGGDCTPCLGTIRDLSVSWVKFFKNKEGFYDAAALVENPNLNAGLVSLGYKFIISDASGVLIAEREGSTFINPSSRQIIFESNIPAGTRLPGKISLQFEQKNWKYLQKEKPFLSVVKKDFVGFPFPRLSAEIKNSSLVTIKNVLVGAVLYDNEDKVMAVNFTKIDSIEAGQSQTANFTWPQIFDQEPKSIEVLPVIDLTSNSK